MSTMNHVSIIHLVDINNNSPQSFLNIHFKKGLHSWCVSISIFI